MTDRIAVIAVAGRFPGAPDVDAFWDLVREGAAGAVHPEAAAEEAAIAFDAEGFGMSVEAAAAMDPQHRMLLMDAREALQRAGRLPEEIPATGVFVGLGANQYLLRHLQEGSGKLDVQDLFTLLGNEKDYAAARVAWQLGLSGPAIAVQIGCASSLAAVHIACQSLLSGESDMAIAGGAAVAIPEHGPAEHRRLARPFDARADGAVRTSGSGVVLLRRLGDALRDGDPILAVIRGTAMNNDGRARTAFDTPGTVTQTEVVREALAVAGVSARTIGYLQAHAACTRLGDALELEVLGRAFRDDTAETAFCGLGSVKPNVGNLDAAAGVASLIATVLALHHGVLPPVSGFSEPNPDLDFGTMPFFVPSRAMPWETRGFPRRAAVHSVAMGGGNVHVVLEEAPPAPRVPPSSRSHLLLISAPDLATLDAYSTRLASWLEANPGAALTDVAWTLYKGRPAALRRLAVIAATPREAAHLLRERAQAAQVEPVLLPAAQRWLEGLPVDASIFETPARRVALPVIPCATTPCWLNPRATPRPRVDGSIAIIGMYGRFPGAQTPEELWESLRAGRVLIQHEEAGEEPTSFVKATATLADEVVNSFDAAFFGIHPAEAEQIDPQIRLLLEDTWTALERAGHASWSPDLRVGVFASTNTGPHLYRWVNSARRELVSPLDLAMGGERDAAALALAFRLDLRGPALNVQTFCSSSLVALHLACRSLLARDCDLAVVAASSLNPQLRQGYEYRPDSIFSRDGACRVFDAAASGTVFGEGTAVVVLRRLEDATADGDAVLSQVIGTCTNNDGAKKIGFAAPRGEALAEVVVRSLKSAGVRSSDISLVEAHGTGTRIGDPIEVGALGDAFTAVGPPPESCWIGSLKANVGHLDRAAGLASVIKVTLSLLAEEIAPQPQFGQVNPDIPFDRTPFAVPTHLVPWPKGDRPRRAVVNALGIGGTNAHAVLEEAPTQRSGGPARPVQILPVSAASPSALRSLCGALARHLRCGSDAPADVAFTLALGRRPLKLRCAIVGAAAQELADGLERAEPGVAIAGAVPVVFAIPGQGALRVGTGAGLYAAEPAFRDVFDRCAERLRRRHGVEIAELLSPPTPALAERFQATRIAQPALFVTAYALARLYETLGLRPDMLIGHSVGELVAACLAGVWEEADALDLVAERGARMQALEPGAMLAVELAPQNLLALLPSDVDLAAINGDGLCVASGPMAAVAALTQQLDHAGIGCHRLHTSHAFHSRMMEPMLASWRTCVSRVPGRPAAIPIISTMTGKRLDPATACDSGYWAAQVRAPVRFADAVAALPEPCIVVELGSGDTLSGLVRACRPSLITVASLRPEVDEPLSVHHALAKVWTAGGPVDWARLHAPGRRRRVLLPTTPFERQSFSGPPADSDGQPDSFSRRQDLRDWFYRQGWRQTACSAAAPGPVTWLVFGGSEAVTDALLAHLRSRGEPVTVVRRTDDPGAADLRLDPASPDDFVPLAKHVQGAGGTAHIVWLWSLAGPSEASCFFGPVRLIKALASAAPDTAVWISLVTRSSWEVTGEEQLQSMGALAAGVCRVTGKEYPVLRCRQLDIGEDQTVDLLLAELAAEPATPVVALRGRHRWIPTWDPIRELAERALSAPPDSGPRPLRERGVVIITGGLSGIGLDMADWLARTRQARMALVARRPLEERADREALAERFQAWERDGAEVMIVTADLCEPAAAARVVSSVRERWGAVHAVIHGAGVSGGGVIARRDEATMHAVLGPKVTGTLALADALAGQPLDFFAVHSSVEAVTADMGQIDYCAANCFLDAWAPLGAARGLPVLVVAWWSWREAGMAARMDLPGEFRERLLADALSSREGCAAFQAALQLPLSHVLISPKDVTTAIAVAERFAAAQLAAQTEPAPARPFCRRALAHVCVPPETEAERRMADVWEAILGVAGLGVEDSFFELGGDSFTAIRCVTAMRRELGAKISTADLFERPTIRHLAGLIDTVDIDRDLQGRLERADRISARRRTVER